MPAAIISLTRLNGFQRVYCFHCAAKIFDDDGPADSFCNHVRVFVDWIGECELGPAVKEDLEDSLDEIEADVPDELAGLFGDDTIVVELVESARGGGHDGSVCLVALAIDGFDDDTGGE